MGSSEPFEATVPTRDEVRQTQAKMLYRGLTNAGMGNLPAMALVESLYNDTPPITMSFVEHTGVFGLWDTNRGEWDESDYGMTFGPRCVMLATLDQRIEAYDRMHMTVREFYPDGTPILEESKEGE